MNGYSSRLRRSEAKTLPDDYLTARLEEAVRGDVCPICAFEGGARHHWLWSFMWENVTNPEAREEFIKAGGLCPADNWALVEVSRNVIRSTLGVALVYQHLAKVVARALREGRSVEPWIGAGSLSFRVGKDCQACAAGREAVYRSSMRLILASSVSRMPEWLPRAFPLCFSHLRHLLSGAQDSGDRGVIVDFQRRGIEEMTMNPAKARRGRSKGNHRLEAAVLAPGSQFPVPPASENLYTGAIERCPVCEALGLREEELLEDPFDPAQASMHGLPCRGHYQVLASRWPTLKKPLLDMAIKEEVQRLGNMAVAEDNLCSLCLGRQEAEQAILTEALRGCSRVPGPQDLLCLPHLTLAMEKSSDNRRNEIIKKQVEGLDRMIGELEDFIALHDYRSTRRPTESPDAPYRWALRFLTSEPSSVSSRLSLGGSERFLPSRSDRRGKPLREKS